MRVTDERFMEAAFEQNLSATVQKQEFAEGFHIRFREGPKTKATLHSVVEVYSKMRKTIIYSKMQWVLAFRAHGEAVPLG